MSRPNIEGGNAKALVMENMRLRHMRVAISATYTITTQHPALNIIVPDAALGVNLPAVADSEGTMLIIVNDSAGANSLTVRNVGGDTIITLAQNAIGILVCEGTEWKGHSWVAPSATVQEEDIANGAVSNSKIADGTITEGKLTTNILTAKHVGNLTSGNVIGAIGLENCVSINSGMMSGTVTTTYAQHLIDVTARAFSNMAQSLQILLLQGTTTLGLIGTLSDAAAAGPGAIKRPVTLKSTTIAAGAVVKAQILGAASSYGVNVYLHTARGNNPGN